MKAYVGNTVLPVVKSYIRGASPGPSHGSRASHCRRFGSDRPVAHSFSHPQFEGTPGDNINVAIEDFKERRIVGRGVIVP